MMTFNTSIEALLADPLSAARAAAQSGRRVIAYAGANIPVELILAADAVPVRLSGRVDMPTPRADEFIERAFHPEVRSIAEQWVRGDLDFIDAILLARSDDSAQRLYYYICELQRRGHCGGPKPVVYDIAGIGRSSSTLHTVTATLRLAEEIGAREKLLPDAARQVDEVTELVKRLSELQSAQAPLPGSMATRMARALHYDWSAAFREALRNGLTAPATERTAGKRLLLVGNASPDERIHRVAESNGACVIRELTDAKWFPYAGPAEPAAHSFEDIGIRFHSRPTLSQFLAGSADTVAQQAQAVRADGVLFWMIEEDNTLGWELPDQLRELEQAGMPVLSLTRQKWAADGPTLAAIGFSAGVGSAS